MAYKSRQDLQKENQALKKRADGWANLLTGMGIQGRDKTVSTGFANSKTLTQNELTAIYRTEGFGRRIIELPVDDMTRKGFILQGDDDWFIMDKLKNIRAIQSIREMMIWGRLYGGAIGIMGLDDGQSLDQPLNPNAIKDFGFIHVFHRWRITWTTSQLYNDPSLPKFGKPMVYTINPITGTSFNVHESRCLIDPGELVPDTIRQFNQGWGDSALQAPYERLRSLGAVFSAVENIVDDFVQAVLTIDNLQNLIATGQENLVKKRLQLLDLSRHIINTMLLDTNERYDKHSSTVTGLDKILDQFIMGLSGVTGIPVTLLMGRSPAGQNSTGDSDFRIWYDHVASEQNEKYKPHLETVTTMAAIAKDTGFRGNVEDLNIIFNPLWELTEKENADVHKVQAEADHTYIQDGVLQPEEVTNSRFGSTRYSLDTELEYERTAVEPDPVAEAARIEAIRQMMAPTNNTGNMGG